VSPEILDEYQSTGESLKGQFPSVDLSPWIQLLEVRATIIHAPPLKNQVCTDPDDDKFLACALAGRVKCIASGDRALQRTSGYEGIEVLSPRQFSDLHLT
jgi:predicted nucleic acid-binding protein